MFISDRLPPTAALMAQIDEDYRDEDGYLYAKIFSENTYGHM